MLDDMAKLTLTQLGWIAERMDKQARLLKASIDRCWRKHTIEGLDDMVAYVFDSGNFAPAYSGSSQLPVGKHPVKLVEVKLTQNQAQTGGFMAMVTEAIDGPAKGQRHTDRLNLYHTNPLTVEIANKQLSAYCHVTGVQRFGDTDELVARGAPFIQEVGLQKNSTEYTEVKALYDINGNEAGKAGAGPAVGGGQPQGQGGPPAGFGAQGNIPPQGDPNAQGGPAGGGWGAPPAGGGQPPAQGGWGAPNGGGAPPQGDPNQTQWGAPPAGGGQPQGGGAAWGQQPPAQGGAQGGNAPWGPR